MEKFSSPVWSLLLFHIFVPLTLNLMCNLIQGRMLVVILAIQRQNYLLDGTSLVLIILSSERMPTMILSDESLGYLGINQNLFDLCYTFFFIVNDSLWNYLLYAYGKLQCLPQVVLVFYMSCLRAIMSQNRAIFLYYAPLFNVGLLEECV